MNIPSDLAHNISRLSVAFVPMLLAIICHEVAHGLAAWKLGDRTAKDLGRLTLNPLAHLDVTGSLLFVVTALTSPFILGWAKPVPVQARYFKNPRKGMMLVALAGPMTNFILAFIFCVLYGLLMRGIVNGMFSAESVTFVRKMLEAGININVLLAWFNLISIPPLDGSHVVATALPWEAARKYYSIGRYGMIIILVLLATRMLWVPLAPLLQWTTYFLALAGGVPPQFI